MNEDAALRVAEGRSVVDQGLNLVPGTIANDATPQQVREALAVFARAVGILEHYAPGSLDLARAYRSLGLLHHEQGDYDEAIVPLQNAVAIYEQRAPGSRTLAAAYWILGTSYGALNVNSTETIVYRSKALEIWELVQPGGSVWVGECYFQLACAQYRQKNMDECLVSINKAIHILQEHPPPTFRLVECYQLLGDIHGSQGNLTAAVDAYKNALRTAKYVQPVDNDRSRSLLARTSYSMAHAYSMLGDYEKATIYAEKAIAVWERTPPQDMSWLVVCFNITANCLSMNGDFDEALVSFQRSIDILEHHFPASPKVEIIFRNVAFILRKQGKYDQALVSAVKAISMHDNPDADLVDLADCYSVAGDVCYDSHTYEVAIFCYQKAVQLLEQEGRSVGNKLLRSFGLTAALLLKQQCPGDETGETVETVTEGMASLVRDVLSLE